MRAIRIVWQPRYPWLQGNIRLSETGERIFNLTLLIGPTPHGNRIDNAIHLASLFYFHKLTFIGQDTDKDGF